MARSAAKPTTSRKVEKLPLEDGRRASVVRAEALDASAGPRMAWWLGSAYAMLVLIGFIAFRLPGATVRGNEMSVERSVFTVINAATLTGFQQSVPIDDYGWLGRVSVFALTVGGTMLTLTIGGLALVRVVRLPIPDARVINGTLVAYLICTIAGTVLLLEPGQSVGMSFFNAASAFGNSGLYMGTLPGVGDWRTHVMLLPLAALGGIGVPVLIDLYD